MRSGNSLVVGWTKALAPFASGVSTITFQQMVDT